MKAKLSIYSVCFNILIYLVLSVSIAGAVKAFPDVDPIVVQYLLTTPSLACIVGTFLVPVLAMNFSVKHLTVAAQILSTIGAVIYIVYPVDIRVLLFASVLIGLAYGVISTVFPMLVNIHIAPEQRNAVTGIGSGIIQFGRLFSLAIAGILGDIKWNLVYLTYFLVIIALCIQIPCLENDKPMKEQSLAKPSYGSFLTNPGIIEIILADITIGIIFFVSSTHISLYIEGYGLGSASVTGMISSISCGLAGALACAFAPVYSFLKRNILCFIYVMLGVGYLAAGSIVSLPTAFLAMMLGSGAMAFFTPYSLLRAAEVTTDENTPMALSITVAVLSFGFFLSPLVTNRLSVLLADGSPASAFFICGAAAIICAVVFAILERLYFHKAKIVK